MKKLSSVLSICLIIGTVMPAGVLASEESGAKEQNAQETQDVPEANEADANKDNSDQDQAESDEAASEQPDTEVKESSNSKSSSTDDESGDEKTEKEDADKSESDEPNEQKSSESSDNKTKDAGDKSPSARSIKAQSARDMSVVDVKGTTTSKLGHLHGDADIYKEIANEKTAFHADDYLNAVYYIKKQVQNNGNLYYLISERPSSTTGTIGWVKASEMSTHTHKTVDKQDKTLYFNSPSSLFSKAWGGKKNFMFDLMDYEGHVFKVDQTETVGNNTWYRGEVNGTSGVWTHESNVTKDKPGELTDMGEVVEKESTSKLGHLRADAVIREDIADASSTIDADGYLNAVYYIKEQAAFDGDTYYHISNRPSSTTGTIGWVKASDMMTNPHKGIDNKDKTLYIDDSGPVLSKAWGGSKDHMFDLGDAEGIVFKVHKTEEVGGNTWYRGELNGKSGVWTHESNVSKERPDNLTNMGKVIEKESTSKLGHLRSDAVIREDIADASSTTDADGYLNAVYYIKEQAVIDGDTYYHISTRPSSTTGTIGWVKASDMSTHPHETVDKQDKTLYFNSPSSLFSKAWGGEKNFMFDLSEPGGQAFKVNLTEKVGDNVWYRGEIKGESGVWTHESNVTKNVDKQSTSKLGHLHGDATIMEKLGSPNSTLDTSKYTDAVYYIKEEANVDDVTYYHISTEPSSTTGTIGWVKASDMSTHTHQSVDNRKKSYIIKGSGNAYAKAWGGAKDHVFDLSNYEDEVFDIHKTEKVGNNTWYRGDFKGERVWIHESFLTKRHHTTYDLTLDRMLDIQLNSIARTDKGKLWVHGNAFQDISGNEGTVAKGETWNVRRGPGMNYSVEGRIHGGTHTLYEQIGNWYHVDNKRQGWIDATKNEVKEYVDPSNFVDDFRGSLQFVKLSESANINVNEFNRTILNDKGVLSGEAKAFVKAGEKYNINEVYLVSHASLETGNGSSTLARGVEVGQDSNGNLKRVTSSNRNSLKNIKTVHNVYGIGANDNCAISCGSAYAYKNGWTTVEKAIIGGAKFVSSGYFNKGQDTLYKMRWNPAAAANNGYATHQYATDIGWAYKQTGRMHNIFKELTDFNPVYDIPEYK